jgi:hypothetical protein
MTAMHWSLPAKKKAEEWTTRLFLVAIGIYIIYAGPTTLANWVLGLPLSLGPLLESNEFRLVFKITVNRASGKQVFQVQQSHISGSNVIGIAKEVHIHEAPRTITLPNAPPILVGREKEKDWEIDEEFRLEPDGYREFQFDLEGGDELLGSVEADEDVSCYVLGRLSVRSFEDGENFTPYWESEDVTRTKVSFVTEARRTYFFVVYRDEEEDEDVSVSVKLRTEK